MMNVSLIIPVKDDYYSFIELINSIENQNLKPNEIIIVDSSKDKKINDYLLKSSLSEITNYIKVKNKYPGEGRNIGIKHAKYELVAFLDSKTIPVKDWLKKQLTELKNNNYDAIFGCTKYVTETRFQEFINSATFGNINHITTPGTLIKKKLLKNNYFIEGVRTADDLEWRERLIAKQLYFDLMMRR